jgi:hypothetical protein
MNNLGNFGVWGFGFFSLSIWFAVLQQANGLRPIRETARSWGDEWLFGKKRKRWSRTVFCVEYNRNI